MQRSSDLDIRLKMKVTPLIERPEQVLLKGSRVVSFDLLSSVTMGCQCGHAQAVLGTLRLVYVFSGIKDS